MKKLLLSLAVAISGLQLSAQCTITPGCSASATGYCTTPAANSSLPNAMEMSAYSTVIQVSVGSTAGPATISSGTVTSITGLPTGLTAATNPSNGVINANSSGCILISGTPAAGTAGNYTVTVNVTITTNFGPIPGSASWMLTVDPATTTGIKEASFAPALVMSPNPAKSELNVAADFNMGRIQVIDALGKVVLSQDANYANQTTIDVHNLNNGVYFIQINDNSHVITRKFIKE